jgi:hypothetical protein
MRSRVLTLFLICLIIALSILDAPEYVRCIDIGLCEFLEVTGHIMNHFKKFIIQFTSFRTKYNFFSILEETIDTRKLYKNIIILLLPAIFRFFKDSYSLIKNQVIVLLKTVHFAPLFENISCSQNLKLIEISVILS